MVLQPLVSVIIPTHNRKDWLRETLLFLARQTWPVEKFEVIVVDDGSDDGTKKIVEETFPFTLRYLWQSNQGDAAARNFGTQHSHAELLVFLDDDIVVEKDYLRHLVLQHDSQNDRIVVGRSYNWIKESNPLCDPQRWQLVENKLDESEEISFVEVCSNNMSLRRDAYFSIGMMQGLEFSGSSMWCDVDFAYRAHQQGFKIIRSNQAICWHRDYVVKNMESHKKRMKEAAYRAVALFQKYPQLISYLPMFADKTPIVWRRDSPSLIARKIARQLMSARPMLMGIEETASLLDKHDMMPALLSILHRWIIGAHIFRGYRAGVRTHGMPVSNEPLLRMRRTKR